MTTQAQTGTISRESIPQDSIVDATYTEAPRVGIQQLPAVATNTNFAAPEVLDQQEFDAIRQRMQAEINSLSERMTSSGIEPIHPKGATAFKLPGGSIVRELELVIVNWVSANMFFTKAWNPNESSPPDCYAFAKTEAGLIPRANSTKIQHADCATCPQNKFGSAQGGAGKGKACRNSRNIVVMLRQEGVLVPEMYTITIPPTSMRAFDKYVSACVARYSCMPSAIVTRMGFVPDTTWAQYTFTAVTPLAPSDVATVYRMTDAAEAHLLADMDYSAFDKK